jgi:hypothetical protein
VTKHQKHDKPVCCPGRNLQQLPATPRHLSPSGAIGRFLLPLHKIGDNQYVKNNSWKTFSDGDSGCYGLTLNIQGLPRSHPQLSPPHAAAVLESQSIPTFGRPDKSIFSRTLGSGNHSYFLGRKPSWILRMFLHATFNISQANKPYAETHNCP